MALNLLSPSGEVYVLNDGGEVDLDLGNYERYLNVTLSRDNNITTGNVYRQVIEKEVRPWPDSPSHLGTDIPPLRPSDLSGVCCELVA